MKVLCPLTDWQTTKAERGKATGNDVTTRLVISADNWNWFIGLGRQAKDGEETVVGQKAYPSMRLLLGRLKTMGDEINFNTAVNSIAKALADKTGIAAPVIPELPNQKASEAFGATLDKRYNTAMVFRDSLPPDVMKRIFKSDEAD